VLGTLVVHRFACPAHGEIDVSRVPAAQRRAVTMRIWAKASLYVLLLAVSVLAIHSCRHSGSHGSREIRPRPPVRDLPVGPAGSATRPGSR